MTNGWDAFNNLVTEFFSFAKGRNGLFLIVGLLVGGGLLKMEELIEAIKLIMELLP